MASVASAGSHTGHGLRGAAAAALPAVKRSLTSDLYFPKLYQLKAKLHEHQSIQQ